MENDVDNGIPVVIPSVKIIRKGSVLVASIPGAPKVSSADVDEFIRKVREGELD